MSTVCDSEAGVLGSGDALRTDTLAQSVLILLLMTLVQRLLGFGRGVLVCRWLDAEQLGQWDVAYGFLLLAAPLAVLGLPGSFGRYFEHFRQRNELRTFLRRTTMWSCGLGLCAIVVVLSCQSSVSQLVFGTADQGDFIIWLALALATIILHNFLISLFIAARMYRVVTGLQFSQTVLFALLSALLLASWELSAKSVVVAFAIASLVSALLSSKSIREVWNSQPATGSVPQRSFWSKLVPFALWIWTTNVVANLFELVDRYMLVHYSGLPVKQAMEQVGNYHSSRVVPLLYVGIAALLSSVVTPYLSCDWESGRRERVSDRLNLVLKLLALALFTASIATLLVGPYLFEIGFRGKFSGGLAVLPLTLTYCSWFGLSVVALNYLWCAERAGLSTLALLAGLVANIVLNRLLLPGYGLEGAVWATAAANLLALVLVYYFSRLHGMRVHLGTWLVSLAPATIYLGILPAVGTWMAIVLAGLMSRAVLDAQEKAQLNAALQQAIAHVLGRRLRRNSNRYKAASG